MLNPKSLLISTVTVLAVALLVLGPAKVFSHMNAGRDRIQNTVDQTSSDQQEVARITTLLRDRDAEILEYQDKLSDLEAQLVEERKVASNLVSEVETQRDILIKAQRIMKDDQPEYTIQGRTYSRYDLEQDVLARIAHTETLVSRQELQRQVVRKLEGALADGRENLGQAMALRREKAAELKTLAARLQNARVLSEVTDIANRLGAAPTAPHSELARSMRALEKRVRDAERRNEIAETENQDGLTVDWEGLTTQDAKAALDKFLSSEPVSDPAPANPDVQVELNRALLSSPTN